MHKILLILFFCSVLFSAPHNLDKIQHEAVGQILKEAVLEKGMIPPASEITQESIGIDTSFKPSPTCNSYADLQCPAGTGQYFVRLHTADLKSGKVECLVYTGENLDRALANYTYVNKSCAKTWEKDKNAAVAPAVLGSAQTANKQIAEITQLQTQARDRAAGMLEKQLNASDLLIAAFTLDNERIDLARSIAENTVRLQSGYTSTVDNAATRGGLSDIATQALGDRITIIFDFFALAQKEIDTTLYISILGFLLAASIRSVITGKLWSSDEREKIGKDVAKYLGTVAGVSVLFLFPALGLDLSQDRNISQSNYQLIVQKVFSEASSIANRINLAFYDTVLKNEIKNRGYRSAEQIFNAAAENQKLEKIVENNRAAFEFCKKVYDVQKLKKYLGGASYIFPLSEEELHKAWVVGNPNVATSPYFDLVQDKYRTVDGLTSIGFSLSLCGKMERELAVNKLTLAKNQEILNGGNEKAYAHREFLNARIEQAYKSVQDWGFISAALLPLTIAQLEIENKLVDAFKVENTGKEEKTLAEDFLYRLPSLLVPGGFTIAEYVANGTGSWASEIPVIGGIFKGAGWAAGVYLASVWGATLILILPYLVISFAGMAFGILLFVEIIAYFISGFFAILLALWAKSQDSIYAFMARGLVIVAKIISFPLSIMFALLVFWFIRAQITYFFGSFANNSDSMVMWMFLQVFAGVCELAGVVVAMFAAYYVLQKLVSKILENLGIKNDGGMGEAVQKMKDFTQRFKNGMPKGGE